MYRNKPVAYGKSYACLPLRFLEVRIVLTYALLLRLRVPFTCGMPGVTAERACQYVLKSVLLLGPLFKAPACNTLTGPVLLFPLASHTVYPHHQPDEQYT